MHQEIYNIDKDSGELKFLLIKWSQFEGDLTTGEILDQKELLDHLYSINRSEREYLFVIYKASLEG